MKHLAIILSLFAFVGCATTMPDRMTKVESFDPKGQVVVIQTFEFNPEIATEVDKEFLEDFGTEIAMDIRSLLLEKGYRKVTVGGDTTNADYTMKGKITEVSGGNKHQRIWLGFGYGGTVVSARGEIVNLKESSTVMEFNITKQSNWTYSNNEAAVRENIYELAKEIVTKALQK